MLEEGDKIREFVLVRMLGRGTFGEVWLAEKQIEFSDEGLKYALKFLFSGRQGIDIAAVRNEVKNSIRVTGHHSVNRIYDAFVERGWYIIVSDFADGGSLADWLDDNGGKAPSIEKSVEIMRGVLGGLKHLHANKIVHRDLKPANILMHDGEPRIADFGTSRLLSSLQQTNVAAGTPLYMSPESFGRSKAPCIDIWAAGVIFYQLLSGKLPFSGDNQIHLVRAIESDPPQPLPNDLPAEFKTVVDTALQKNETLRYSSAAVMLDALNDAFYSFKKREIVPEPQPDNPNDTIDDPDVPDNIPKPGPKPGEVPIPDTDLQIEPKPRFKPSLFVTLPIAGFVGLMAVVGILLFATRPQSANRPANVVTNKNRTPSPSPTATPSYAIPELEANVKELKLFGGDGTNFEGKTYTDDFYWATTRWVNYELKLKYGELELEIPLGVKGKELTFDSIWYKENKIWVKDTHTYQLSSTETALIGSVGFAGAGKWDLGNYRLDISYKGRVIASKNFRVR